MLKQNCSQRVEDWRCSELKCVEKIVWANVEEGDDQSDVENNSVPLKNLIEFCCAKILHFLPI